MKALTVEMPDRGSWAAVSGRDAYTLLVAVGSRPLWSHISKAWMCSHRHGLDVAALADRRGYVVSVRRVAGATPVARQTPDCWDTSEASDPGPAEVDLFGQVVA